MWKVGDEVIIKGMEKCEVGRIIRVDNYGTSTASIGWSYTSLRVYVLQSELILAKPYLVKQLLDELAK